MAPAVVLTEKERLFLLAIAAAATQIEADSVYPPEVIGSAIRKLKAAAPL